MITHPALNTALSSLDQALTDLESAALLCIGRFQDQEEALQRDIQELRQEYGALKEASTKVGRRLLSTLDKLDANFGYVADAA
jgi:hypothetical protein